MSFPVMAMATATALNELRSQGEAADRLEMLRKQLVSLEGPVTKDDSTQAELLQKIPGLEKFHVTHLAGPSHDSTYDRLVAYFPKLKGWLPLMAATNRIDRSYVVNPEGGSWPNLKRIMWQAMFEAYKLPHLEALKKTQEDKASVGEVLKILLTPPADQKGRSCFLEMLRTQVDKTFKVGGIADAIGPYDENTGALGQLSQRLEKMITDLESNPAKVAEFVDKKLAGYDELRQLSLAHLYAAEQLKKQGCTGWPAKYTGFGEQYAKIGKQFMKLAGLVYNRENWMKMEDLQGTAINILRSMKPGKRDVRFLQVSLLRRGLDDRTTLRFDSSRTAIDAKGKDYPMTGAIAYVGQDTNSKFFSWVANGSRDFMGLALRLAQFKAAVCSVKLDDGADDHIPPDKCPPGEIKNKWATDPKCVPEWCKRGTRRNIKTGRCDPVDEPPTCPPGTIKNKWARKPKCVPENCKHGRRRNGTCKTGTIMKPMVWD